MQVPADSGTVMAITLILLLNDIINIPFPLCVWLAYYFSLFEYVLAFTCVSWRYFLPFPSCSQMKLKNDINWLNVEIQASGAPCLQALLAPCVQEHIHSNTTILKCEKHQEVIDVVYNNAVRTNHHWKGDQVCHAVNTSHFNIPCWHEVCYRNRGIALWSHWVMCSLAVL